MYYRCRLTEKPVEPNYWPKSHIYTRVCTPNGVGQYQCPENLYCGSPLQYGISLMDDGVLIDPSVQFGIYAFSDFGQALLAVIQTITAENWISIMNNVSIDSII
jgi:hypothetical protein